MNFLGDILSPNVKRHNFTICELEGKQPKKMAPPPPPPPPNLGKVRIQSFGFVNVFNKHKVI
jgi:hypothetical protein